ncbi:MAG: hypothetical protein P4L35_10925 [Ignavibacteriaceae bacterium]|nr:hypothetical protein [Ignavibacteriaceae bacterium]
MAFVPYHGGFAPTPGISDPIQKLMEGYRQSQAPAAMKRQAEMEELKKQLLGTQAKYAPQQAEAGLNQQMIQNMMSNLKFRQEPQRFKSEQEAEMFGNYLKQAQAEKMAREAQAESQLSPAERLTKFFSGSPDAFKLKLIQDTFGADSKVSKDFEREILLNQQNKLTLNETRESQNKLRPIMALPSEYRGEDLAREVGAGAPNYYSAMKNIAENNAANNPDVAAIYPTAKTNIAATQERAATQNQLKTIQPRVTNNIAPYAREFGGYSIAQVAQLFGKDKNEEKIGKYLAGRQLEGIISAIQATGLGVKNRGAINQMLSQDPDSKIIQAAVSPNIYQIYKREVADITEEGIKAFNQGINKASSPKSRVITGEKTMNGEGHMSQEQFRNYIRGLSREDRLALKARVGG